MKYDHLFEALKPGDTFIFEDGDGRHLRLARVVCSNFNKFGRRFRASMSAQGVQVMRIDGTDHPQARPIGKYRAFLETLEINKLVDLPNGLARVELCHASKRAGMKIRSVMVGDKVMVWRIA